MKKENFGIPATLLCLVAIILAYGTNFFGLIALTIAAFALGFSSRVKKVCVQAIGLSVISYAVFNVFFSGILGAFDVSYSRIKTGADVSDWLGSAGSSISVLGIIYAIIVVANLTVYVIWAIATLLGKDIILAPVHKAVDGFVPMKQYAQQPYGQPQQFNGQPQQFNGQPQQFNGQPQQFNGQPQQFNGQPQQFNNPNNGQ